MPVETVACSACGSANASTNRFCGQCAAPLALVCRSCGASSTAGQRFCGQCAASLEDAAAALPHVPPQGDAPVAENRRVSVVFVDLVGFTTLSEGRDAEDVRELLSGYFDAARTIISRYGGVVGKFIGDAGMAVWGLPAAPEGDGGRCAGPPPEGGRALSASGG